MKHIPALVRITILITLLASSLAALPIGHAAPRQAIFAVNSATTASAPSSSAASTTTAAVTRVLLPLVRTGNADGFVSVYPQLDTDHAATTTIPVEGGTITATAADGSRFTLTIPPKALVEPITLTMTPVSTIGGLPLNRLAAAVQLRPDEFVLEDLATLQIDPASPPPPDQEVTFAYEPGGANFHRYPLQPHVRTITVPVLRLRGYGVGQGNPISISEAAQRVIATASSSNSEAQFHQQMHDLLRRQRQRLLLGFEPDPELESKLVALVRSYYVQFVAPVLGPMQTSCSIAEANAYRVLGWARKLTFLGLDTYFVAESQAVFDAVMEAWRNCYNEAAWPCLDQQNSNQVSRVLGYYRRLVFYGQQGTVTAIDELPKCTEIRIDLQGGQVFERELMPEQSTVRFVFPDPTARSVVFANTFAPSGGQPEPLAQVRARYRVTNQPWVEEDWTNRSARRFCRDTQAGRIEELEIYITQIAGEPSRRPTLAATNVGCWRWQGTAQATYTTPGDMQLPRGLVQTTTATATFERMAPQSGTSEYYQVTNGTLQWELSGVAENGSFAGCSYGAGPLTFSVEQLSGNLITWNYDVSPFTDSRTYNASGTYGFSADTTITCPNGTRTERYYYSTYWLATNGGGTDNVSDDGLRLQGTHVGMSGRLQTQWSFTAQREP